MIEFHQQDTVVKSLCNKHCTYFLLILDISTSVLFTLYILLLLTFVFLLLCFFYVCLRNKQVADSDSYRVGNQGLHYPWYIGISSSLNSQQ